MYLKYVSRIKSLLPAFGALNEREEEEEKQEAKEDEEVIQHIWALSLKKSDMTINMTIQPFVADRQQSTQRDHLKRELDQVWMERWHENKLMVKKNS